MKHKLIQQRNYFSIKDGMVERSRKYCPRCGDSFMSQHKDRVSCGKCKLTIFEEKK